MLVRTVCTILLYASMAVLLQRTHTGPGWPALRLNVKPEGPWMGWMDDLTIQFIQEDHLRVCICVCVCCVLLAIGPSHSPRLRGA